MNDLNNDENARDGAPCTSNGSGRLDIILGPMYAGKSSELLRRLTVASIVDTDKVLYINHSFDIRSDGDFSSHNSLLSNKIDPDKTGIISRRCSDIGMFISENKLLIDDMRVIGIDEIQFFGDVRDIILDLVENKGKHIILSGLSSNFKREQIYGDHISSILSLISYADRCDILKGRCMMCSKEGIHKKSLFTSRLKKTDENVGDIEAGTIDIGGKTKYMALCRSCYIATTPK